MSKAYRNSENDDNPIDIVESHTSDQNDLGVNLGPRMNPQKLFQLKRKTNLNKKTIRKLSDKSSFDSISPRTERDNQNTEREPIIKNIFASPFNQDESSNRGEIVKEKEISSQKKNNSKLSFFKNFIASDKPSNIDLNKLLVNKKVLSFIANLRSQSGLADIKTLTPRQSELINDLAYSMENHTDEAHNRKIDREDLKFISDRTFSNMKQVRIYL